jgi:hypothetical protein
MNMSYMDFIYNACNVLWMLKRMMSCCLNLVICLEMLSTSAVEVTTATKNGL